MTKRILLYAAIYGGIGVAVGVLMAFYTKDAPEAVHLIPKTISLNGSKTKVATDSAPAQAVEQEAKNG